MKQINGVNQFERGQKVKVIDHPYRIGWEMGMSDQAWQQILKLLQRGKTYTVNMTCGPDNAYISLVEDPTGPECYEIHPNHFIANE